MRSAFRIAIVAAVSVIYAPAMVLATIQIVGAQNLQAVVDWVRGAACDGGCSPPRLAVTIVMALAIGATLPVLVWTGILWIRRARRSNLTVAEIRSFMRETDDWNPTVTSETEPDVPRFYRDRQGRLRPMEGDTPPA